MTSRLQEGKELFCVLNFDQISQSTAQLLLFLVAENKRPPYLNSTPGFDELFTVIGMWFCTDLQNFCADRMIAYGVMTSYWFYKMAAKASQIYFRLLIWPRVTSRKTQSYWHTEFRPDISIRPRYYYFRFLKTNGRHLEILLPVSILTFSLLSACDSALAYQILSKSDYPW